MVIKQIYIQYVLNIEEIDHIKDMIGNLLSLNEYLFKLDV